MLSNRLTSFSPSDSTWSGESTFCLRKLDIRGGGEMVISLFITTNDTRKREREKSILLIGDPHTVSHKNLTAVFSLPMAHDPRYTFKPFKLFENGDLIAYLPACFVDLNLHRITTMVLVILSRGFKHHVCVTQPQIIAQDECFLMACLHVADAEWMRKSCLFKIKIFN